MIGNGRRQSLKINIGDVAIGGDAPIVVQSMTNTDTRDWKSTVDQIKRLEERGCEIVRIAIPDMEAAEQIPKIKKAVSIPIIADIHFDFRLALEALKAGVDGLRINPGNIGGFERVRKVVESARERQVPIRIGVNSGSVEKDLIEKYGGPTPEAMVESAIRHINMLEALNFNLIKISLKSSSVLDTIEAYRLLAKKIPYPFHLGVTEAGSPVQGAIKSALGIGILLYEGIGDTIRVSITGPPEEEIPIAYGILRALGLRKRGAEIISCPTCGRTEIDLIRIVREVEERLAKVKTPIKVAIMGCVVNGPGEAREADVGIAGGRGKGIIFKEGKHIRSVPESDLTIELIKEVENITGEKIL
ncbi:MAG: flavodoxin-dependent (E)-4-hydroxy-3-methylbut-2-enyl-diphosphate synthase [Thermodesulforhabdaceae bacterium]